MRTESPRAEVPWVRRQVVVDAASAVLLGVVTATGSFGSSDFFGPGLVGHDGRFPPPGLGLPLAAAVTAVAWWRRRIPLAFLAVTLVVNAFVTAQLVVMVALYTLAERTLSWPKVAVGTAVAVAATGVPIGRYAGLDGAVPLMVALCIAPALFGLYVGTRHELVERIRERAERVEREQRHRMAQARSDERAQIARDMHDVVTHRVALMVLHATALEATRGSGSVAIGRQIGRTGREALAELRSLVGVLRNDDDVPLVPQPGFADLGTLVESSRQLGLPVALDLVDETDSPPPSIVQHAVYRVVQEALTNVHKHAPGARTWVRIRHTPDGLRVAVRNGRGETPRGSGLPEGGYGLVGMVERIRLVGGRLTGTRTADGGYELLAHVPLTDPDAT